MSQKNSTQKILFIVGVSIIILLGLGIFLISQYADPWAKNKISEKLEELEKGPLKLQYDSLNVDIASGHLSIHNVKFRNSENDLNYEVQFKSLAINGLGILKYLINDRITIKQIQLSNPHIRLIKRTLATDSSHTKSSPSFPSMLIKKISIDKGSFEIDHQDSSATNNFIKGNFELEIEKFEADSSKTLRYKFFDAQNLHLSCTNAVMNLPDSLYMVEFASAVMDTHEKIIELDSVKVKSKYSKYKMGPHAGHEIDWIDLTNPRVKIHGLNFGQMVNDSIYHADCISIEGLNAEIFRDKRLPFPNKPDTKLLHQLVAQLKVKIDIDTIKLQNANIEYQEFVKQAVGPGAVRFDQLYASFYHLTNVDNILKQINYTAHMDAQSKVMGQGLLKASFSFPLTSKKPFSTVTGSLSSMDLTAFNPMLQYVGFTRIKQGKLLDLDFDLKYNENESDGTMNFVYEDLKINTLDKESNTSDGLGENVKSFLANTFIVRTNNTKDKGKFRVGNISFKRDKKKSIFNYWWKSLLTGFRSSTGIEAPEERIDVN